ncbi:MAG: ATPase domain-containing protein [Dehalococcoidia bacterium]|nr:ATPase domain-containing protein [Dehalococcoidia bacterium]
MTTKAKAEEKLITSGSAEIDRKMGGGIPKGSLTLIEGQSDAGKSVLTQQIIWGSLNTDCRVTLFSTESTIKNLMKQLDSLGLHVTDYLLLDRLRVYPVQLAKGGVDINFALKIMSEAFHREADAEMIIIDSLTSFVTNVPVESTIAFFEDCKNLCNEGQTILIVIHAYAFSESTLVRVRSMCDAHLNLRIEQLGDKLLKVLEVSKIRGATRNTGNIVAFEIEPGWGMRIIPVSKAQV